MTISKLVRKEALPKDRTSFLLVRAGYGRELLMVLNVLPILGPSKRMTAMTTIAIRARIIAYSTRPWPFSFGANNIVLFLSEICLVLRTALSITNRTLIVVKSYTFHIMPKNNVSRRLWHWSVDWTPTSTACLIIISKLFEWICRLKFKLKVYLILRHFVV